MAFLTDIDYLAQISKEDLGTLTEEGHPYEEPPTESEDEPTGDEPAPELVPTVRELAEMNAMAEVAGYLRGRYDMEAAYSLAGSARNAQLVMTVVDVTLWHLVPRVTFRTVSDIRENRYKAAIKWLTMCQEGKSNPDLPKYKPSSSENPQRHRLFRVGSQPARSHSF